MAPTVDHILTELDESVVRLRDIVEGLDPAQLTAPAYPTEWTIAATLSHIGSGAVIMRRVFGTVTGEGPVPDDFNKSVWDEWNAKALHAKAADTLAADRALVDAAAALTDAQRAAFTTTIGPMTLDLAGLLGLRLNEHVMHTWDIEVALDPHATAATAAGLVVDNLGMIVHFAGRPHGPLRTLQLHTTDPTRHFTLVIGSDSVALDAASGPGAAGSAATAISLPAEALARLVYGRLDPGHTPAGVEGPEIDGLRRVFPGF